MHIKVGDTVVVIAGKDRFTVDKKGNKISKTGVVIKSLPRENKVVVKDVNIVKKHERATTEDGKGQITKMEAPINVSNVMILDPKQKVPTRVGYKVVDGKKVRYVKKSGEILDK